jgi:hypothetical protein
MILADWAYSSNPSLNKVLEGEFKDEDVRELNAKGYNVYYLPNYPSQYERDTIVDGTHIDCFEYVFVDCDFKDKKYKDEIEFVETLMISGIRPTRVVSSGNGVHAYWRVVDLDGMSYLRFQRRLMRLFNTDPAVGKLFQLMRLPNTINVKKGQDGPFCHVIGETDISYTAEELHKLLPPITLEDEDYCKRHYDKTFNLNQVNISSDMPAKWGKLLNSNLEVKALWTEPSDDRSGNDFRLGHIMFANGFTKEEAATVLASSAKALQRSPVHRISYASNIIDKIWTFEIAPDKSKSKLSKSIKEILQQTNGDVKGKPFRCHPRIDNTAHGFRLTQVIGLVAGSGVGKTAFALNMFRWFAQNNPEYHHFFIPLEQPAIEVADRWKTMCGEDTSLHEKIHVISNYDDDGTFRHLSFDEIKDYIVNFQKENNIKAGCVVIDHIGALKKKGKDGENQDIMDICHAMKAFAIETQTLLVMQSQTSREKAKSGDIELDKDAAYGTVYFESYCDYLITLWQPLKRCHSEEGCPSVTAFKFCKIRHKKVKKDVIQEDVPYYMYFDSDNEHMRDMTEEEKIAFKFFAPRALNKRKADKSTDVVEYKSVFYTEEDVHAAQSQSA